MSIRFTLKIIFATAVLSVGDLSLLHAQVMPDVMTSVVNYTPQFFIAILAGVLLALAFQAVLTMISVASGVSMIGNLDEPTSRSGRKDIDRNSSDEDTPMGVKISSAVGGWATATAAISLFFASYIAVKLIFIPVGALGLIIGLIIWAAFFLVMMYVEVRAASSLLGGIMNAAMQGFRSALGAVKGALGKSEENKMADAAQKTIDVVRKEIAASVDNTELNKRIDDYINRLQPRDFDYNRMKKDIAGLLNNIVAEEKLETSDSGIISKTFLKMSETHPALSREQVKKMSGIVQELKEVSASGGSEADKLLKAVDKFTPGSEEDTRQFREKIENYLRNTKKEELNPDSLKKDLETIMRDPKSSRDVIRHRIGMMNRSTVTALISQRSDINKEEANKIVGYVERALDYVKGRASQGAEAGREKTGQMSDSAQGMKEKAQQLPQEVMDRVERKLKNYFDSLNREEFNYDRIKMDFQAMFNDPSSAFDILKSRLNEYDRDSIVALLSSSDRISRAEAQRIVDKIVEARDNVIWKAEKIQEQAKLKMEEAKEYARHQAELTRQVSASAAWWLVAAAFISGIAAGVGGMIGIA